MRDCCNSAAPRLDSRCRRCSHTGASLAPIGARLDVQPELLFTLRQVDAGDLIASANDSATLARRVPGKDRLLESAMLSEIFGLEIAAESLAEPAVPRGKRERVVRGKRKPKRVAKAKKAKKTKGARKKRAS